MDAGALEFEVAAESEPLIRPDCSVDYRNVQRYPMVVPGDRLAVKHPPEPGGQELEEQPLAPLAVGHVDPEMTYWTTSGEVVCLSACPRA